MKRRKDENEDLLKGYFSSEIIEKAPDGFTSRIMENIHLQPSVDKIHKRRFRKLNIPVVSALATISFVIAAFFIPGSSSQDMLFTDLLKKLTIPSLNLKFNTEFFSGITLPALVPYVLISILLLLVFDQALSGLFHREKK